MRQVSKATLLVSGTLFVALLRPVWAGEPQPKNAARKAAPTQFIRIAADKGEPTALETAVVRYRAAGDLTVDLVSVVHIGEAAYYRKLNKLFADYDVVLYELVAPQGTVIPKGGRNSDNPLSLLQKAATLILALDLQTEHVDYTRKNFVHADLSPQEMAEAIRKRGDSGLTIALSVLADLLRQQNLAELQKKDGKEADEPDLLALFTDPTGPAKFKRLLAQHLAAMDKPDAALGRTLSTILVDDRNQAAMKVLHKQIEGGKKKIAIFYGAAHMPDFEKRLRAELDLAPAGTQWVQAWDLRLREVGLEDLLFRLLGP